MNIEERLERLESFIGDVDKIRLYANSLQAVLDRYIQPLYIENGAGKTMRISDYLGDLDNIPHNIIFKIRASHDLALGDGETAVIRFERGGNYKEYPLRKMVDGSTAEIESSNYISGEVYDIYLDSQDIAIITANDTGVRALSEIAVVETALSNAISELDTKVTNNYSTLDSKIDTKHTESINHTNTKTAANKELIDANTTFRNKITKDSSGNYTFAGNITVNGKTTSKDLSVTNAPSFSKAFTLPSGTLMAANPSANMGIAAKKWVEDLIASKITDYHSNYHYNGTGDASSAMKNKPNNSYYYKY